MSKQLLIVALGGTLRPQSSTERVLAAVLSCASAKGARTRLFGGASLNFPMYVPGVAERELGVREFLVSLRDADAIVIGSPGYHGGVSGLVKNALDYTEEMASDPMPYFSNKPVGCLATGLGWQGCNTTLQALRCIVHALRGWPTPIGIALNTKEPSFDASGICTNRGLETQIELMVDQMLMLAGSRLSKFRDCADQMEARVG